MYLINKINEKKTLLTAIICFISYFFVTDIISLIFDNIFSFLKLEGIYLEIYSILKYLIFPILLFIIYKDELIENLKRFKNKVLDYLPNIITPYFMGFMVMLISNMCLIYILRLGQAANEQQLNELSEMYPVYVFVASCFIGPFIEEIVFRFCLRKIIRNDKLFIILSGVIFGLLHVLFNMNGILDLLFVIPYGSLGCAFAYMYVKTDNIWTTISVHTLHNTFLSLLKMVV